MITHQPMTARKQCGSWSDILPHSCCSFKLFISEIGMNLPCLRWVVVAALLLNAFATGCQRSSPKHCPEAAVDLAYASELYRELGCSGCHQLNIVNPESRPGPTHNAMGVTAERRIADPSYTGSAATAAEYIRESIVNPRAYLVPGYDRSRFVMPTFTTLGERELQALVQLLLQAR
jgi:hypothetical protein